MKLTDRQQAVWKLIAAGMSDRQIASKLGLSYGTTKIHASALYHRIGARNRVEAALRFHGISA